MPLIKSLICFKGFDNGRRYLAISLACYLIFILLSPAIAQAGVLLVILILVASPVLAASSIRRMHDAGFARGFALIPLFVFWLCVFAISYSQSALSWLLLILALVVTLAMALIRNARIRHKNQYVMGYSGPVDLTANEPSLQTHHLHHTRIEPTLTPTNNVDEEVPLAAKEPSSPQAALSNTHHHWETNLGQWMMRYQKQSILAFGVLTTLVLVSVFWPQSEQNQTAEPIVEQKPVNLPSKQRLNKIEMPDNFWVMLDEFDALTIGWQGDITQDGELWSAITGQGDQDCVQIKFSIRDEYRSLRVTVKNAGDYYADFSPVDTAQLIKSIALRDKFKLCGYEFSLKGTQAKLMNNRKYASYFEEE